MDKCKELKLNLVGVSFHVGCYCSSEIPYLKSIDTVKELFRIAALKGFRLSLVDLGGGFADFPGHSSDFKTIGSAI
jgi:ornithine decarboxylase